MKFIKMHSYGNNFIIINNTKKITNEKQLEKITNKNHGILYEQAIIIEKIINKNIYIKILNNNITKAYNCVNGIRCLSYIINKKTGLKKIKIMVEKANNHIENRVIIKKEKEKNNNSKGNITYYIGNNFNIRIKKKIIFRYTDMFIRNIKKVMQVNIYNNNYIIINVGNNHIIRFIKEKTIIDKEIIKEKKIIITNNIKEEHNFSIFSVKSKKIRTLEAGVGFTNSCGSATLSCCISYNKMKKIKKININNIYGYISFINNYNNKDYLITGKVKTINYGFIKT